MGPKPYSDCKGPYIKPYNPEALMTLVAEWVSLNLMGLYNPTII